jgi:hypothetical protein
MKKIYIIFALFLFLIIILIVYLVLLNLRDVSMNNRISPNNTPSTAPHISKPVYPTVSEVTDYTKDKSEVINSSGTGVLIIPPSQNEIDVTDARFNLRNILPIANDNFKISYNNDSEKFDVIILQPYDKNIIFFRKWIIDNKLVNIPESDINLINKF